MRFIMDQPVTKATNESKASVRQLKQFAKLSGFVVFYVGGYTLSKISFYKVLIMTQTIWHVTW